jgi:hypothetical protein
MASFSRTSSRTAGSNADEFGFAFSPCQGAHLIGQDDAGHATASRQRNLERIALALAGGAQAM